MTRPLSVALAVVAAVALFLAWQGIDQRRAFDMLRAQADSAAAAHQSEADSLARINVAKADSLARLTEAYTADSLRWATQAREDAARAARARQRATEAAAGLVASLDSAQTARFGEYVAERDSLEAVHVETIASLTADRAALWAQRDTRTELVAGLQAENVALRMANDALRQAIEVRDMEIRAKGRTVGILKVAGLGLLGLSVYDRISGG